MHLSVLTFSPRIRSRERERERDRDRYGDRDRYERRSSRERDWEHRRRGRSGSSDKNDKPPTEEPPVKKRKETLDPILTRTGGAYIPPAKLRMMQAQITDKSRLVSLYSAVLHFADLNYIKLHLFQTVHCNESIQNSKEKYNDFMKILLNQCSKKKKSQRIIFRI